MRLTDLRPRWIERDGRRLAIMFLCPHCVALRKAKPFWLSCFFVPTERIGGPGGQYDLFEQEVAAMGEAAAGYDASDVVPCRRGFAWQMTGSSFDDLSITPSLDASASGNWHGHVTNGQIIGGL